MIGLDKKKIMVSNQLIRLLSSIYQSQLLVVRLNPVLSLQNFFLLLWFLLWYFVNQRITFKLPIFFIKTVHLPEYCCNKEQTKHHFKHWAIPLSSVRALYRNIRDIFQILIQQKFKIFNLSPLTKTVTAVGLFYASLQTPHLKDLIKSEENYPGGTTAIGQAIKTTPSRNNNCDKIVIISQ